MILNQLRRIFIDFHGQNEITIFMELRVWMTLKLDIF